MLLKNQIEFSYFSLQLLEYIVENHPHRANDYDFIKLRGDRAAAIFESALADGYPQEEALRDASEELFAGLHFSFHAFIRDILWDEFSEFIQANKADEFARYVYPILSYLQPEFNPENYTSEEEELSLFDESVLRANVINEIKQLIELANGI